MLSKITDMKTLIAVTLMYLMSCNQADNHEGHMTNDTTIADAADLNTSTIAETQVTSTHYSGVLPCADCTGIETEITLKSDSTYSVHSIYNGRKANGPGSNEFNESGKWMLHGTEMIHLSDRKDAPNMFIITDSTLTQLDMNGKKIEGKLADKYILKKSK